MNEMFGSVSMATRVTGLNTLVRIRDVKEMVKGRFDAVYVDV